MWNLNLGDPLIKTFEEQDSPVTSLLLTEGKYQNERKMTGVYCHMVWPNTS